MDGFDSILVRLKGGRETFEAEDGKFRFHTGSIKSLQSSRFGWEKFSFDSILVRLKGFTITVRILYAILVVRVKSIFRITIFRVVLLSTSGRANSLGG